MKKKVLSEGRQINLPLTALYLGISWPGAINKTRSLSLCSAAKLGPWVSWIPLIPTKDKHPTVARSLLCVQQTTAVSHTQHEQPCLKLLEQDVVCFVSCHLTDSYTEGLNILKVNRGLIHPLGLFESSAALHPPSRLPQRAVI